MKLHLVGQGDFFVRFIPWSDFLSSTFTTVPSKIVTLHSHLPNEVEALPPQHIEQ